MVDTFLDYCRKGGQTSLYPGHAAMTLTDLRNPIDSSVQMVPGQNQYVRQCTAIRQRIMLGLLHSSGIPVVHASLTDQNVSGIAIQCSP